MAVISSSSSDSQNMSVGSYSGGFGGIAGEVSPRSDGIASSGDNCPLQRLRRSGVPPLITPVTDFAPVTIDRGAPSPAVESSVCTLKAADLSRLCTLYDIDRNLFQPILPLSNQSAYDPPMGYEAVYENIISLVFVSLFLNLYFGFWTFTILGYLRSCPTG